MTGTLRAGLARYLCMALRLFFVPQPLSSQSAHILYTHRHTHLPSLTHISSHSVTIIIIPLLSRWYWYLTTYILLPHTRQDMAVMFERLRTLRHWPCAEQRLQWQVLQSFQRAVEEVFPTTQQSSRDNPSKLFIDSSVERAGPFLVNQVLYPMPQLSSR